MRQQNSKSTIAVNPTGGKPHDFAEALRGTLLGGSPIITDDTQFLGIQEKADVNPSITTLKQVEMIGAQLAVAICRRTKLLRWALLARKLCLERMHHVIQGLLPLALTAPLAALRLNALQGRWAHVILMGRASYTDEETY